jgi:hypothetical protein
MFKPVMVGAGLAFVCAFGAFASSTPNTVHDALLPQPLLGLPSRPAGAIGGSEFARRTSGFSSADRDRAVVAELERGNMPSFLGQLTPVTLTTTASNGQAVAATIWVTPDYLAIGSDDDFLYVPLTYYSATIIADRFGTVLPTARMVDAIYEQSAHHLKPTPLPAGPLMGSNLYLAKHQQRIDAQRSGLPLGQLIAGHHLWLAQGAGRSHPAAEHRPRSALRRLQPRRPPRQRNRRRRRPPHLHLRRAPGLGRRARPEPRGGDAGSLGLDAPPPQALTT